MELDDLSELKQGELACILDKINIEKERHVSALKIVLS